MEMDNVHVSWSAAARLPALSPAHVAIAAAVATPVLLAGLRVLSPEFDPSYRLMSEYALGRYGWVLSLTFLAWGVGSCALALAIRSQIRTRGGRIGVAFLVVAGLGQALAALFDIRHDVMHNLAGAMGILGLPFAAVLVSVSLGRNPSWSPLRRRLLMMAHLTWISVIVWVVSFVLLITTFVHVNGSLPAQAPPALPHGVIGVVGWANRLLVVIYCSWVAGVASQMIRLRHNGE
jgi:Protein of unknown function (DUF998)